MLLMYQMHNLLVLLIDNIKYNHHLVHSSNSYCHDISGLDCGMPPLVDGITGGDVEDSVKIRSIKIRSLLTLLVPAPLVNCTVHLVVKTYEVLGFFY